jgi:FtsP/CotA-like multicopper oxidase with cupredoxin domain
VLSINNTFPGSTFPAPTIKLKKGDTFKALVTNNLNEPTVLHWHGIRAPSDMDGHPKYAIAPGGTYDVHYLITKLQRAGTYFYHSHADMNTARQSYMGMMGIFIIEDDNEKPLGLPSGEYDIPLLIQDKRFDANKQLVYAPTADDMMTGWLGDTILTNGTPDAFLSVAQTMYRFRLINGSNARIYTIALDSGASFTIIGNDGGLLENPAVVTSAILAPAERLDIIIDFSSLLLGTTLTLKSGNFNLLVFRIDRTGTNGNPIPSILSVITKYDPLDVKQSRSFELTGNHYINSESFKIDTIHYRVNLDDLEEWDFINLSDMDHPMHVHGVQFQVIDPQQPSDAGWKDVIRVAASSPQPVKILLRYSDYPGLYLLHCHNMEHEDMGMMANIQVDPAVAVKEEKAGTDSIEISPNPARDHTELKFPSLLHDEMLMIADEKGSVVLKQILSVGSDTYKLSTAHFASGSYSAALGEHRAMFLVLQ